MITNSVSMSSEVAPSKVRAFPEASVWLIILALIVASSVFALPAMRLSSACNKPVTSKPSSAFKFPFAVIGEVGGDSLKINDYIDLSLSKLNEVWRESLAQELHVEV